jgi:hypothetical protein
VWVDDQDFDVAFHVRRSALPSPGTEGQLRELAARIMSRPLDRARPLWEVYLVEGLEGGRFAILTKTHHAMIDGTAAVDIGQVILDPTADPKPTPDLHWNPSQEPSGAELVAGAVVDNIRRPAAIVDHARKSLADVSRRRPANALRQAGGLVTALWSAARPPAESPLNVRSAPSAASGPRPWTSRTSRPSAATRRHRQRRGAGRGHRGACAPG